MAGEPTPASGSAADLRRSVTEAAERIAEIIDAAERSAAEIRAEAEAEADGYLTERRREADRIVEQRVREADTLATERADALAALIGTVSDSAERFRLQAEEILTELDRVVADARAGIDAEAGAKDPVARPPIAAAPPVEPGSEPGDPEPKRPPRIAAVRPAPDPADDEREPTVDRVSEAVLRATQMAVVGKEREEIAKALRADFPDLDTDAIVDEILD